MTTRRLRYALAAHLAALLASALMAEASARADLLVVVNPANPLREVTPRQLSDLYLGRSRSLASGQHAYAIDQTRDGAARREFFERVNGMPLRQVNAYWARLQFSGEVQPPPQLASDRMVIEAVRRNPDGIGYVDASAADNLGDLRVVLRLR